MAEGPQPIPARATGGTLVGGWVWVLFGGLTVLTLGAVWLLVVPGPDVVQIDSSASALIRPAGPRDRSLRFAIAPVLSPERRQEDYRQLAGWLGERLGRPIRIVQRRTYGEINDLLRTSSVDLALICTGAYLLGKAEGLQVTPVVVPVPISGPTYHSLILARADSDFDSFEQVARGRLALADPLSLSGHLVPLALAQKRGLDPQDVLSRAIHTYSHDNSIHAVEDGIVDGAAVNSLLWEFEVKHDPGVTVELKVIERSPSLAIQPVVVPLSLDPVLFLEIRRAMLALDSDLRGRRILERLGLRSFEQPTRGLYDETEAWIAPLVATLNGGK
jgi:phosphonate transport system substrate-binding protein